MATFQELAVAEYQARVARDSQAGEQARAALLTAAHAAAVPLFTDFEGKLAADPTKVTTASVVDVTAGLVILTLTDGSRLSLAIYPNQSPVERYVVEQITPGQWVRRGAVADMDDVGGVIAGRSA